MEERLPNFKTIFPYRKGNLMVQAGNQVFRKEMEVSFPVSMTALDFLRLLDSALSSPPEKILLGDGDQERSLKPGRFTRGAPAGEKAVSWLQNALRRVFQRRAGFLPGGVIFSSNLKP